MEGSFFIGISVPDTINVESSGILDKYLIAMNIEGSVWLGKMVDADSCTIDQIGYIVQHVVSIVNKIKINATLKSVARIEDVVLFAL